MVMVLGPSAFEESVKFGSFAFCLPHSYPQLRGLCITNRRFAEKRFKKLNFPVTDPLSLAHPGKNKPFGRTPDSNLPGGSNPRGYALGLGQGLDYCPSMAWTMAWAMGP